MDGALDFDFLVEMLYGDICEEDGWWFEALVEDEERENAQQSNGKAELEKRGFLHTFIKGVRFLMVVFLLRVS